MNRHNRFSISSVLVMIGIGLMLLFASAGNLAAQSGSAPEATPTAQAAPKPNLAGQWKLNKDQSDDPMQKMRQAMGDNGGGGGGRGGSGGGAGGGGGRGGMRRGGQGGGMMNYFSQLTIEQTETSVKVSGASGRVLASYPQDQKAAKPAPNGDANGEDDTREYTPPVAKWQGAQLVTTSEGRRGGSTTGTYELSSDAKQLIVTTKMQNPRMSQPVTFKLVYDQAKASTGSSQ